MLNDPRRQATVVMAFGLAFMTTSLHDNWTLKAPFFILAFFPLVVLGGVLLGERPHRSLVYGALAGGSGWALLLLWTHVF